MAESGGDQFPTVLGPDAKFKGELTFEKGLRLQGQFEGSIKTPGKVHVAKEAKLNADVESGAVIIEGEVKGNLQAADRIELKNTARYEGDLTANKLVVDEGAVFQGHVSVGPDAAKPTTTRPQASPGINRPTPGPNQPNQPQKQG
ncbi:MAG: polymer-forming cytoskeletal protein [Tepidisphaeraceae bacterium]